MSDVMVDLETMGNGSNAAIVAIGAVEFCPKAGLGRAFYEKVSLQSSVAHGLSIDASTVVWWLQQSDEARAELTKSGAVELPLAIRMFTSYLQSLGDSKALKIWGNGATFDNVILRSAYKAVKEEAPWAFWNDRCFRTLKAMNSSVALPVRGGVHHNALDDAKYQAECAIVLLNQGV